MSQASKVILVTGASSGLGRAIARQLHAAGHRVHGTSRRPDQGSEPFGMIQMDIDHDESVNAAIEQLAGKEGRIDAVVNNAGWGLGGSLEDTRAEEAIAQFQTNFFGTHRVCRAALPHLRRQRRAHIVVIGSLAGRIAIPFQGMYSATKFALEGYCEVLRMELRDTAVRVAIVEPGDFATGFTAARQPAVEATGANSAYRERFAAAMKVIEQDEKSGADPVLVGRTIECILRQDRPALRHLVGPALQTAVTRAKPVIPSGVLENLIADHYQC